MGQGRDSDGNQRSLSYGAGDKIEKSASHSLFHLNFGTATEPRLRAVRILAVLLNDLGARSAARVGERFGSQRSNGSISVHEHARGRGLRADESEFARVSTVRKEALPVLRSRCDQRTTLATLTVKIVATARTLSPAATHSVTSREDPMNRAWSSLPASARPAA